MRSKIMQFLRITRPRLPSFDTEKTLMAYSVNSPLLTAPKATRFFISPHVFIIMFQSRTKTMVDNASWVTHSRRNSRPEQNTHAHTRDNCNGDTDWWVENLFPILNKHLGETAQGQPLFFPFQDVFYFVFASWIEHVVMLCCYLRSRHLSSNII